MNFDLVMSVIRHRKILFVKVQEKRSGRKYWEREDRDLTPVIAAHCSCYVTIFQLISIVGQISVLDEEIHILWIHLFQPLSTSCLHLAYTVSTPSLHLVYTWSTPCIHLS